MNQNSSTPSPGLVRGLGPAMAVAVVVGTVIGSGVFKKPQAVAAEVPYTGLAAIAWVLVGVLALLGALSLAEVGVLYPKSGGNYVFLREGYGRLAGFLWGWVDFWIIRGASIAALATIFSEQLHTVLREAMGTKDDVLHYWAQQGITVAVILGLALVNVRGVKWGGGLQLLITTVKVGSLVAIAVLPFLFLFGSSSLVRFENLLPVWPPADLVSWELLGKFGAALVGVIWAYHGWMNIVPVAEEVKEPQRNIPLALIGGVGIIIVLYLSVNLAYGLVINQADMAHMKETPGSPDKTVAVGFASRLLGSTGGVLMAAAVMCSVFGALNGLMLIAPRLLFAMGEDGLAPRALGEVHPRYRTPAVAILTMAVWSAILVLATAAITRYGLPVLEIQGVKLDLNLPPGKPLFDVLTDFAIFGAVVFETLAVTTIFVFRTRQPQAERPYRCWGYPVVPAVYTLIMALVAANMFASEKQRMEPLVGTGFIAVGALVYLIWLRPRSSGQKGD